MFVPWFVAVSTLILLFDMLKNANGWSIPVCLQARHRLFPENDPRLHPCTYMELYSIRDLVDEVTSNRYRSLCGICRII